MSYFTNKFEEWSNFLTGFVHKLVRFPNGQHNHAFNVVFTFLAQSFLKNASSQNAEKSIWTIIFQWNAVLFLSIPTFKIIKMNKLFKGQFFKAFRMMLSYMW